MLCPVTVMGKLFGDQMLTEGFPKQSERSLYLTFGHTALHNGIPVETTLFGRFKCPLGQSAQAHGERLPCCASPCALSRLLVERERLTRCFTTS